jgi:integrase
MAINIQQRGSAFQLRVTHKLLKRRFICTFDTREQADEYGTKLNTNLNRGVIPPEIQRRCNEPKIANEHTTHTVLNLYSKNEVISKADKELIGLAANHLDVVPVSLVTYEFVLQHAKKLRTEHNLSPTTVTKRIACIARAWQYHLDSTGKHEAANLWRKLPNGSSVATDDEKKELLAQNKKIKYSVDRDYRFEAGDEDRIARVFAGEKLITAQRTLNPSEELHMMYRLILWTGVRLRECYMLEKSQIDLTKRVIHVKGTKGARGVAKPRDVPIRAQLATWLKDWIKQLPENEQRLFPRLWDGSCETYELTKTTNRLSQDFSRLFKHAQMDKFTEHDLRHEATCRWFLLKNEKNEWVFRETMIQKIMGWSDPKMLKRYASLRGDDLAELLGNL